jgi:hypothetical protein
MSAPAEPKPGQPAAGDKAPRRGQRHRPHHQHYKRTSAIIDDRPDGKPILFNYGRHMTKLEKEQAKVMIAYSALAAVVAICLAIVVVFAVFNLYISPNQTVATINGIRINRHDSELMTAYYTAQEARNGTTPTTAPSDLAISALQRQTLTVAEAKKQYNIVATSADVDAEFKRIVGNASSAAIGSFISQSGLNKSDYLRLVVAPQALERKVGAYLTRNNAKVAEQWHYARIQAADKKTATQLLNQIALNTNNKNGTQAALFAKLAKSKSKDTASASNGGDMGWERPSDTTTDSLLGSGLIAVLQGMQKTHTTYKLYNTGTTWYVLEFLGHDLKRALSSSEVQTDEAAAFNAWYQPLLEKAVANPPLVSNPSTSAPVATTAPAPTQAIVFVPTAVPATPGKSSTSTKK